jgi:hypothetical protein
MHVQNLSFFSMAFPAHSGPRPLIQFRNHFSQTAGLLGRVISPPQGRYLNTGRHKHRISSYTPNIHALSGLRTHDSSVRASEDSSCLRPCGYCDRHKICHTNLIRTINLILHNTEKLLRPFFVKYPDIQKILRINDTSHIEVHLSPQAN